MGREGFVERVFALRLKGLGKLTEFFEKEDKFLASLLRGSGVFELVEQVRQEPVVVKDQTDDFNFVEEDKTGEGREHVLLEHRGGWENHILDVLDSVCLVNFCQQFRVGDRDHLVELGHGLQIFPVSLGRLVAGLKLETTDNIEDGLFREHDLEQSIFVEKENVPEYLVQVMKTLRVLQIFTHVEDIEQFL